MESSSPNCFAQLVKEVPKWLEELKVLAEGVERWRQMHSGEQGYTKPKHLRNSSSTDSVRHVKASPTDERRFHVYKHTLSGSGQQGGRPSSRKLVVVHYDTDVQKQLESLVGMTNVGRSFVFREKTATRRQLRMDNFSARLNHNDPSFPLRKRGGPGHPGVDSTDQNDHSARALREVETALIEGQRLAEHIAHQLLRDGDCDNDLEAMKTCFESILRTSMEEASKPAREDSESTNMKKQKFADISTIIMPTGSFGAEATMHSLDVDEEEEELDGFTVAVDRSLATC